MDFYFGVTDWAAWMPGLASREDWLRWSDDSSYRAEENKPDLSAIPAMQRRRLSPMAKAATSVMLPLFNEYGSMPIIFVSRHGELERTVGILQDIANEEPISPTAFSLSVHNAIAGMFTIQNQCTEAVTAIGAGKHSFVPALFECLGQITEQTPQVLCVFCDRPLLTIYEQNIEPEESYALALVINSQQQYGISRFSQQDGIRITRSRRFL